MKKVLLLTLVFPPDAVSTAHLLGDLVEDLHQLGHQVCVLTTTPHYNQDMESEAVQPLKPFLGEFVQKSSFRGIPVYHILMPRKGQGKLIRIFAWIWFHCISLIVGMLPRFRSDIVLSTSPPLTIGFCGGVLAKLYRGKGVYNIWELYPDVAIHTGFLKHPLLIMAMRRMESMVYRLNHHLCPIGVRMAEKIGGRGVPKEKISIIPNAADVYGFKPMPRQNQFSCQHHLNEKFVVSYAGNLGRPQGLDTFLRAATRLKGHKDLLFVMIGDGNEKDELLELAKDLELPNFKYLGYLPYSAMPEAYAACDLSLVAQVDGIGADAMPSKIFRILAAGRPVLTMADQNGDLASFVQNYKVGLLIKPGDDLEMANAISWALKNRTELRKMGEEGRRLMCEKYCRKSVASEYSHTFSEF
ncbi:glycosyltransferase family 4 protein [Verrucomicrobia bacterium]|nr:glycosyltransferase family 4 protein [Verrucomicrobiota bacterium]